MPVTIPQLARMLGLSRTTVYRKVRSGEISGTKAGHDYIISDSEIDKALGKKLSSADKKRIDKAVKKTVREYGEVLKLLGDE